MYWMLECYGILVDRAGIVGVLNDSGRNWLLGRPFKTPPPSPLEVEVDDGAMVPMFYRGILLFSDAMLKALQSVGVDNLEIYSALLVNKTTGARYENYKAINILGLVAAADLSKSKYVSHTSTGLIDTDFDSLTIDPSKAHDLLMFRLAEAVNGIVIHDRVKVALEKAGIKHLDFVKPEKWIG